MMKNATLVRQVKEATRDGFWAWPGGYPMFAVCRDGGVLCGACVRKDFVQVMRATRDGAPRDWSVAGLDINHEDGDLYCDHCGDRIAAAYGDDAPQWQVVVGNIGQVCETAGESRARDCFEEYVRLSREGYGRAAGESVALFCDGDLVAEHSGTAGD